MLVYFSVSSAAITAVAILAAMMLGQRGGGMLTPPLSQSMFDDGGDVAMPRRAGWLPYWGVIGMLAGMIVRSVSSHWVILTIIAVAVVAVAWRWASPIFYRCGGVAPASVLAFTVGIGFAAGWIFRVGGLWLSVTVIVAATLAAMMVRRPTESGFLNKP